MIAQSTSSYSATADVITLVIWTALAAFSVLLLRRIEASHRGAWYLVAAYCIVVAADKAFDLQMTFYHLVRWLVDMLDPMLDLHEHRAVVRLLLLVSMTSTAVIGSLWLVRRDRHLNRSKKLAIAGLVLVLLLVGLRQLSSLHFTSETTGWMIEGTACLAIACALRQAWLQTAPARE